MNELTYHLAALLVIWKSICTLGYVCLQGTLLAVPTLDLGRQRLEIASAIIVSIEMVRYLLTSSLISLFITDTLLLCSSRS